jgi:hypothetical protein
LLQALFFEAMKHVLVPVLSPEDVTALPNVVAFLQQVKPLAVVVMNNPSVGVSPEDATKAVDAKIAQLEQAKKDAVAREDFPAASSFKEDIEAAKMDRQTALREGWKTIPQEQRIAAYDRYVTQFGALAPTHVRSITLQEDATTETLLNTLANLGKVWPDCLPQGEWSLVYPRSVSTARISTPTGPATASQPAPKVNTAPPAPKAPVEPKEARRTELKKYMKMRSVAKGYGIQVEGRKTTDVIEEILAKEFAVAA